MRKVRLPTASVQTLRDLRDSYMPPRPVPKLINAALRQTRNAEITEWVMAGRNESTVVDVVLDDEFAGLEQREIRARVQMALDALPDNCLDTNNIKLNRGV
jgi:hypothetical protein